MGIGEYSIKAELRDATANPKAIRRAGKLPAVVYGKETEPMALEVDAKEFRHTYKEAGESALVNLEIAGKEPQLILFKDPQYDPRTGDMIHVDFYQIKLGEKIRTDIPLVFEGESPAVKDLEGLLITNKDKIEVECLPRDLPKEIVVDISQLAEIDSAIAVKDLKLPEGVEALDDPEDSIVLVTHQREEEEEPVVSEEDAVADVQVEGEKANTEDESQGDAADGAKAE